MEKREYNPTLKDIEIIKQCLIGFDPSDNCSYSIDDDGNIYVKTAIDTWKALAGREWLIDVKNKKCKLVSLN